MGKVAAMVAACSLLLALTGCLAEQKRQTAECIMNGMKIYPDQSKIGIGGNPSRESFVRECMESAGYEYNEESLECQRYAWKENAYCYNPSGIFGRYVLKIELMIDRVQW